VVAAIVHTGAQALAVPAAPPLDKPVVDMTATLSTEQIGALNTLINQTRQEKSYQIGVLLVASMENQAIDEYSLDVARTWKIGDKTNNGVLLLVAKNDRLMRIEVGSGLEGDLTDAEAGRIIRNVIAPEFRAGNYYAGIQKAITSIKSQVEKTADPNASSAASGSSSITDMIAPIAFFGIMLISWFGSLLARSRSWWAGGIIGAGIGLVVAMILGWALISVAIIVVLAVLGLLFDYFVSSNYYYRTARGDTPSWWAGGTWIDGGGSGGGSFGGGGFSGGGASGDW